MSKRLTLVLFLATGSSLLAQSTNQNSATRQLQPGLNVINSNFTLSTAATPLFVNVAFPPNATSAGLIVNGAASGSSGSITSFTAGPSVSGSVITSGTVNCIMGWTATSGTLTSALAARNDNSADFCNFSASPSDTLLLENFGFAIPANAVITGIAADIVVRAGLADNHADNSIRLLKAGVATGNDEANGQTIPVNFTDFFYGGGSDLWGTTWQPADINNSGFGIALKYGTSNGDSSVQVDFATLTISYTISTPGTTGTGIAYFALETNPFNTQPLGCVTDQLLVMSRCPIPATGLAEIQFSAASGSPQQISFFIFVFTGADMLRPGYTQYSPVGLGVNALTLPASTSSALSNTIDMRQVRQAMLLVSCTQPVNLNIDPFDEDGVTPTFGGAFVITTNPQANLTFHMSSEEVPQSNATVGAASAWVQFPQRAMAFSFANSTANAGTCTGRLFVAY